MWIKQEIILSKNVRIFCGTDQMEWQSYESLLGKVAVYDIRHQGQQVEQHPKSRTLIDDGHTALLKSRKRHHVGAAVPDEVVLLGRESSNLPLRPWAELWDLLGAYGEGECFDPHDKVYAIIPLMPKSSQNALDFHIDYRQPLISLCLDLIQGFIREFSATAEAHQVAPVQIWVTLSDVVNHWIRPDINNPTSAEFKIGWSLPDGQPALGMMQVNQFTTLLGDHSYAPKNVMGRIEISNLLEEGEGHLRDTRIRNCHHLGSISKSIPSKEVFGYVADHYGRDHKDGFVPESEFSIPSLPPELPLKLVMCNITSGFIVEYCVPHFTEVGDEILTCRFFHPGREISLSPIVRPYRQPPQSSTEYRVLIGWALPLDVNWDLGIRSGRDGYASVFTYPPPKGGKDLASEEPFWFGSLDWEEREEVSVFNAHHEDLILHAMLLRDLPALLSTPCTHREHPSYFLSDFFDPVKFDETGQTVGEKSEERKPKKPRKGVKFA
jgi:hypothetical protein